MAFVKAGPAEILRSSQKDDSVIKKIEQLLENILLTLQGPRVSIKHKNKLQRLAHLLYYTNTTLCGLQTLGEEYTGILQVDCTLRNVASFFQRSIMVILDCFGTDIVTSFLNIMEQTVQNNSDILPDAKTKLLSALSILKKIIPFVGHIHKAYFYCHWGTYHLSKRISGINYVLVRYWLKDRHSLYGFKLLGIITFINLFILAIQSSREFLNSRQIISTDGFYKLSELNSNTKQYNSNKMCTMCLNNMIAPSCTPCGHIFCWDCILEWLNNDNKCPICRETVIPCRVVQLINY